MFLYLITILYTNLPPPPFPATSTTSLTQITRQGASSLTTIPPFCDLRLAPSFPPPSTSSLETQCGDVSLPPTTPRVTFQAMEGLPGHHQPLHQSKCDVVVFLCHPPPLVSCFEQRRASCPTAISHCHYKPLPLTFQVTEGKRTYHRPLPCSNRERGCFPTTTIQPTCVSSDGGDRQPPPRPPLPLAHFEMEGKPFPSLARNARRRR